MKHVTVHDVGVKAADEFSQANNAADIRYAAPHLQRFNADVVLRESSRKLIVFSPLRDPRPGPDQAGDRHLPTALAQPASEGNDLLFRSSHTKDVHNDQDAIWSVVILHSGSAQARVLGHASAGWSKVE